MMAWPEEPQPRNVEGEWPDTELLESTNFYPSDAGDERAQHGANNFLRATDQGAGGPAGLTYSASCPSFSGMDDTDGFMGTTGGNGLMPYPFDSQEPVMNALSPSEDTPFPGDKNYDMLLQFQQDYQNPSQRQFPHQQVMGQATDLMQQQQLPGGRRGFHGSQSFTSLSSMESEYNRMNANSKRKKGTERWMKLQRHKSFDSSTAISEPFNFDPNATFGNAFGSSNPTPDQLLQEPPDSDMIGFSIDDFPPSNDPHWSSVSYGSAPDAIGGNYMQQAHQKRHQQQHHASIQSLNYVGGDISVSSSAEGEPVSELDMLLSENERANLFDAIRDFESPNTMESVDAQPSPEQPPQQPTQISSLTETKERSGISSTGSKKTPASPSVHPGSHQKSPNSAPRPFSLDSASSTLPAGMPPSGCVPMRTRLHQILVHSVQNSDAGSSLSSYERNYLMQSPLFFPAKAPETAGSLWLLLHAAQCESGCEIGGCSVMRRVLNHCLGCELVVGKCKQPCNDAKAMLLHYGSCNSKGSMHGRSCSVCWNLLEIDYSHQALSNGNGSGRSSGQTPSTAPSSFVSTSPSPLMGTPPLVPMPMSPRLGSSPAYRSPSRRSTSTATTKHVPIQPNPLPTASNPMGLMGALPPHFGYSLSLYLEQTSAPFRAEVKSRVEKRVTAAAGQDLLQHMQKKTRLRSLDDLRSEARTVVLGEMERELHLHMQAYSWASSTSSGRLPDGASQLPPYLLNFSVAGFGAFQAQQAAFQTAGSSLPPAAPSTSPP
ncbi:uncharacterized protein PITG_13426 [Phytophthora infestans T30-4]|uniref:TAZ-type domain-containing protein n=2 Tax=Phytophthora infestans TaxID=4787 RepID=D0NLY9_PHYIT|nr:uncharacterized protein PITG_13426 [Phytophthora infestans T30-4]EEY60686.1 conserved hypothetical protein [Phytophthora infestans T30-4]|eukprot:XP_002900059.1 conserved hypothetical protein [Phytophthora infestans T30-4]